MLEYSEHEEEQFGRGLQTEAGTYGNRHAGHVRVLGFMPNSRR